MILLRIFRPRWSPPARTPSTIAHLSVFAGMQGAYCPMFCRELLQPGPWIQRSLAHSINELTDDRLANLHLAVSPGSRSCTATVHKGHRYGETECRIWSTIDSAGSWRQRRRRAAGGRGPLHSPGELPSLHPAVAATERKHSGRSTWYGTWRT